MTTDEVQSKFDKFVQDNNGKPLEVEDPGAKDQCFDLALGWCDILGIPREAIRHQFASQIWTNPLDITLRYFEYIPNTSNGIPQKGDLVVFAGIVGHVSAAFGKGDPNTFDSFDQNWDTINFHDNQGNPICRTVTHDYKQVLGWLRPRTQSVQSDPNITDQSKYNFGEPWGVMEMQATKSTLNDQAKTIQEKNDRIQYLDNPKFSNPIAATLYKAIEVYKV